LASTTVRAPARAAGVGLATNYLISCLSVPSPRTASRIILHTNHHQRHVIHLGTVFGEAGDLVQDTANDLSWRAVVATAQ